MAEDDGLVRVYKVAGKLNLADILTKVMGPSPFARLRHALLGLESSIQAVAVPTRGTYHPSSSASSSKTNKFHARNTT
jgi:hypothetical protein